MLCLFKLMTSLQISRKIVTFTDNENMTFKWFIETLTIKNESPVPFYSPDTEVRHYRQCEKFKSLNNFKLNGYQKFMNASLAQQNNVLLNNTQELVWNCAETVSIASLTKWDDCRREPSIPNRKRTHLVFFFLVLRVMFHNRILIKTRKTTRKSFTYTRSQKPKLYTFHNIILAI